MPESRSSVTAPIVSIEDLQALIAGWADRILPHRTLESIAFKLIEEALELVRASRGVGITEDELADIFILAIDAATVAKVGIADAVCSKMRVNEGRRWEVRADGTAQHIEDEA